MQGFQLFQNIPLHDLWWKMSENILMFIQSRNIFYNVLKERKEEERCTARLTLRWKHPARTKATDGNISAKSSMTEIIAPWQVWCHLTQTRSKPGDTRFPHKLAQSLGSHPGQISPSLTRPAPAYWRSISKTNVLWVRWRKKFERKKSRRDWFEPVVEAPSQNENQRY